MKVVLFDMDGTLTKHRSTIQSVMCSKLAKLLKIAKVGIVTGSKLEDVYKQCHPLLNSLNFSYNLTNLYLMPCNGTQVYEWDIDKGWQASIVNDMVKYISNKDYQKLIRQLVRTQLAIINDADFLRDFNIESDFLDYRGSLMNWCPIGRSSMQSSRANFISIDKEKKIRDNMIQSLKAYLIGDGFDISKINISKGGQTSVDIYPTGWDKTYALKYFMESPSDIYFVGDACEEGQNDYELYMHQKKYNQAFITTGPTKTIAIIDDIIKNFNEE